MASFVDRIVGAAKLNVATYEEVEADTTATSQAMVVVVLSAVSAGIAQLTQSGVPGLIGGAIGALVGWFVWAFVTFIVGTKLLPEPETQSNLGELLRTIGFASAPGVLYVVGAVPGVGGLLTVAIWIWTVIAFVIAVRQALDYKSTGRAVVVVLIGGVAYLIVLLVVLGMIALVVAGVMGVAGAGGG
jgi:hypothetical protein